MSHEVNPTQKGIALASQGAGHTLHWLMYAKANCTNAQVAHYINNVIESTKLLEKTLDALHRDSQRAA